MIFFSNLKTSYVIVQQARDETGREKKSFKNILCYCSTLPPFNISREQRYLKTSYVIVQPKAKWSNK